MNNTELSNYILHYMQHDKTGRAIMLSGAWGVGKSYYVQHDLKKFLERNKCKCIVISLYEQNSVEEISKSIFWEAKNYNLKLDKDDANVGLLVAKTVLKGITGHFGIDLTVENEELLNIYRSVNLSDTLIVFEDLERTKIDIIAVLGFINTLVEEDEAKVLIVANEAEIIKTPTIENVQNKENKTVTYTENTERYLSYKEKTIEDTILYFGDYSDAVINILKKYNLNIYFENIDEIAGNIVDIMKISNNYNLRSVIFTCQKAKDIFDSVGQLDCDYKKCIIYGILYYSFRISNGNRPKWTEGDYYSPYLGSYNYPLFKFAYDYINYQIINKELILKTEKQYIELKEYEKSCSIAKDNLKVISSWWLYFDKDVKQAVEALEHDLKQKEIIALQDYGRIAQYIIAIKNRFGKEIDIEKIKTLLVDNLRGKGTELSRDILLFSGFTDEDKEYKQEVKTLLEKMVSALDSDDLESFNYTTTEVTDFYNKIKNNGSKYPYTNGFANKLDIQKMIDLYFKCSPEEMFNFRGAFKEVYYGINTELYRNDKDSLNEFLIKIKKRLENEETIDITQKVNTDWLIERMETYISLMESTI